jgi:chromosome segregation ATPase
VQSLKDEQNSIFHLQSERGVLQAELQKLSDENGQLRIRISQKEDEVMQLENERQEHSLNIQSLADIHQSNIESLQRELDDTSRKCTNAKELLTKLQIQYNILSDTYAESTCQLYGNVIDISNTIIVHECRLQKMKAKLSKSKSLVTILKKENLALGAHRSKLRKRLRKLWPNYHGLKKNANQREAVMQELKAKVSSLTQLNEEMETLLQANTEEISMLQCHFKEALNQLNEKTKELDNLANVNQNVDQRMSESHKELKALQANLLQAVESEARGQLLLKEHFDRAANLANIRETEFHSTVTELKRQLDQATSYAEKLRIKNEELAKESFELKSINRKQDGKITELEDELYIKVLSKEKLTRTMEMEISRIDEMNQIEVNRLTEKIRELQESVSNVEEVRAGAMNQLKSDILTLEQKNHGLHAAITQLESEREHFTHNLHEAERARAKSVEDRERLECALVEMLAGKEKLENEMQRVLNEYTVQRESSQRLNEQFQKQVEELESCRLSLDERLLKKETEILELQQLLQSQETQFSEQMNQRNARIYNLEAETSELKTEIYSREKHWETERTELQNWLRQQEKELQKLVAYHAPHEDTSCQTDFSGCTMAVATIDLDQVDRSIVDMKDREIVKMKTAMKKMLGSIREEHRAILTVWHNLGSRMYRDTFYQRV